MIINQISLHIAWNICSVDSGKTPKPNEHPTPFILGKISGANQSFRANFNLGNIGCGSGGSVEVCTVCTKGFVCTWYVPSILLPVKILNWAGFFFLHIKQSNMGILSSHVCSFGPYSFLPFQQIFWCTSIVLLKQVRCTNFFYSKLACYNFTSNKNSTS